MRNQARPYSDQEGARGKMFVLRADLVSAEVRSLLQTVARAVLLGRRGTLSEQVKRLEVSAPAAAPPPLSRAGDSPAQRLHRRGPRWSFSTASAALPLTAVST